MDFLVGVLRMTGYIIIKGVHNGKLCNPGSEAKNAVIDFVRGRCQNIVRILIEGGFVGVGNGNGNGLAGFCDLERVDDIL